jgi:hypothetical protein
MFRGNFVAGNTQSEESSSRKESCLQEKFVVVVICLSGFIITISGFIYFARQSVVSVEVSRSESICISIPVVLKTPMGFDRDVDP